MLSESQINEAYNQLKTAREVLFEANEALIASKISFEVEKAKVLTGEQVNGKNEAQRLAQLTLLLESSASDLASKQAAERKAALGHEIAAIRVKSINALLTHLTVESGKP